MARPTQLKLYYSGANKAQNISEAPLLSTGGTASSYRVDNFRITPSDINIELDGLAITDCYGLNTSEIITLSFNSSNNTLTATTNETNFSGSLVITENNEYKIYDNNTTYRYILITVNYNSLFNSRFKTADYNCNLNTQNIFPDSLPLESASGSVEYRVLYLYNEGDDDLTNIDITVYEDDETINDDLKFWYGDLNEIFPDSGSRYVMPNIDTSNLVWKDTDRFDYKRTVLVPDGNGGLMEEEQTRYNVPPGNFFPILLRRTIGANQSATKTQNVYVHFDFNDTLEINKKNRYSIIEKFINPTKTLEKTRFYAFFRNQSTLNYTEIPAVSIGLDSSIDLHTTNITIDKYSDYASILDASDYVDIIQREFFTDGTYKDTSISTGFITDINFRREFGVDEGKVIAQLEGGNLPTYTKKAIVLNDVFQYEFNNGEYAVTLNTTPARVDDYFYFDNKQCKIITINRSIGWDNSNYKIRGVIV